DERSREAGAAPLGAENTLFRKESGPSVANGAIKLNHIRKQMFTERGGRAGFVNQCSQGEADRPGAGRTAGPAAERWHRCRKRDDRKSTRLNSSHVKISYAVFC